MPFLIFVLISLIHAQQQIFQPSIDDVHRFNFIHDALSSSTSFASSSFPIAAVIARIDANVSICRGGGDPLLAYDAVYCEISGIDVSQINVTVTQYQTTKRIGSSNNKNV